MSSRYLPLWQRAVVTGTRISSRSAVVSNDTIPKGQRQQPQSQSQLHPLLDNTNLQQQQQLQQKRFFWMDVVTRKKQPQRRRGKDDSSSKAATGLTHEDPEFVVLRHTDETRSDGEGLLDLMFYNDRHEKAWRKRQRLKATKRYEFDKKHVNDMAKYIAFVQDNKGKPSK